MVIGYQSNKDDPIEPDLASDSDSDEEVEIVHGPVFYCYLLPLNKGTSTGK